MNGISYETAMAMGTLTQEQLQEQLLLAKQECRTDDMVSYCNLLLEKHADVPQECLYGGCLVNNFIYQFNLNSFYPIIVDCIAKGNQVCEQMKGLLLVLFYRLKDRCYNFALDKDILSPYETPFSEETVSQLENLLKQYDRDRDLKEKLRAAGLSPEQEKKLEVLFCKLMILIADMKLKAVTYTRGYTGGGPSGIYDVRYKSSISGVSNVTVTEREKEIYEHVHITRFCITFSSEETVRKQYVKRLRALDKDYPVSVNTWEGYGYDLRALNAFFRQFGIVLDSKTLFVRKSPDLKSMRRFYKELAPTRDFVKNVISPHDHMASLFIESEEQRKLEETDTEHFPVLQMILALVLPMIPILILAYVFDQFVPRILAKAVVRLLMLGYIAAVIFLEVWVVRSYHNDRNKKKNFYKNQEKQQLEYIRSLYAGKLPLV